VSSLDAWLPRYTVSEFHERVIDAPAERAMAALLAMPVDGDPIVRTLLALRGLAGNGRTMEMFGTGSGLFVELERTPTTFVFGGAHPLRRGAGGPARDPQTWLDWPRGGIKIVADFRALPLPGDPQHRTRLTTETRVLTLDRVSHLGFRAYWTVIGPFSALIRRRWLAQAAAAATAAEPIAATSSSRVT
jgi:hypothetical protein